MIIFGVEDELQVVFGKSDEGHVGDGVSLVWISIQPKVIQRSARCQKPNGTAARLCDGAEDNQDSQ